MPAHTPSPAAGNSTNRPANPTDTVNLTPATAAAAAAGGARKRKLSELTIENDGRIAASDLDNDDEPHVLIDRVHAVDLGLCAVGYSTSSNTCPYKFCPFAASLNDHACGEGGRRMQKGQAKAQNFCIHPKCLRFYHCTCHAIMHRRLEASPTLLAPKKQRCGK